MNNSIKDDLHERSSVVTPSSDLEERFEIDHLLEIFLDWHKPVLSNLFNTSVTLSKSLIE